MAQALQMFTDEAELTLAEVPYSVLDYVRLMVKGGIKSIPSTALVLITTDVI